MSDEQEVLILKNSQGLKHEKEGEGESNNLLSLKDQKDAEKESSVKKNKQEEKKQEGLIPQALNDERQIQVNT
jgi:hypothetical protein